MDHPTPTILGYARAAGGAEVIAPVLARLKRRLGVVLFAGKYAEPIFSRMRLHYRSLTPCSWLELTRLLQELGIRPRLILTSAAGMSQDDMVEKHLWRWGQAVGIPSVGVLDQWHNFALRFSGPRPEDHMAFLPSHIVVMDEYCKNRLVELGVDQQRILILGHPVFDELLLWKNRLSTKQMTNVRDSLGVTSSSTLITFLSEPISRVFGTSVGYTEQMILTELIRQLCRLPQRELLLLVKPHPRNRRSDFLFLRQLKHDLPFRLQVLWQPVSSSTLLANSDLVVGMSSILLLHSIVLGVPTMSVQIGSQRRDLCIACIVGAIPFVSTSEQLYSCLTGILDDPMFRKHYLADQARFRPWPGAAKRIESKIYELLGT